MSTRTIQRIAVVNRGEPAVRFIRALREYNVERETEIRSLALFTHADEGAPFVRMADEAARLGPAMVPGADGKMISAYMDHERIIQVLQHHRCDAVWPGWGFVSEDPIFVGKLEKAGIVFLGPSSQAMQALGDKIESKKLAEDYGVPVSPWTIIGEQSEKELLSEAERIGYPLMVKASAGGGGRGIRKVRKAEELIASIQEVEDEVKKVFGQGGIFMEACITEARHIEVQLLVGIDGEAVALGIRDCSIQRRNQKVIEEGPSPVASEAAIKIMCDAAKRLAEGVSYRGAGTAEYLYKPETDQVYFLEVNSRLQVEHTVTEMITGADLVKSQIDIARALPWDKPTREPFGHAIEVRLNAENPSRGFQPAPGFVRVFQPPSGPGLRIDSGVVEGMAIAPEFDSMIAKIIAWGRTRTEAIARLTRALREFPVVIEDGATNKAFLLDLLASEKFLDGSADTSWLDRAMEAGEIGGDRHAMEAALAAAIIVYRQGRNTLVNQFMAQSQNGIPQNLDAPEGMKICIRMRKQPVELEVLETGRDRYLVGPPDEMIEVTFRALTAHTGTLYVEEERHELLFSHGSTGIYVEIDGAGHDIEELSGGTVKSPSPAMVVSVAIAEGDTVEVGDRLVTLEAMKMEMPVFAQEAGVVTSVLCLPNMQVSAGQALVVLDTTSGEEIETEVAPSLFEGRSAGCLIDELFNAEGRADILLLDALSHERAELVIEDMERSLRNGILGYDMSAEVMKKMYLIFKEDARFPMLQHPERLLPLARILRSFVAVESLFDRNLLPLEDQPAAVSAQISFYEYCRNHRLGEEAAPAPILASLLEALALYKVTSLEPSDELREALWRLAVAHAHPDLRHRICSSILRGMIALNQVEVNFAGQKDLPLTLERVALLARQEHRAVSDSARQASYELFQRHQFVQRDQQVAALIRKRLEALGKSGRGSETSKTQVMELLSARQSLMKHLAEHGDPKRPQAALALEVLVKRFYQNLDATPATIASKNGVIVLKMEAGALAEVDEIVCVSTDLSHFSEALTQLANHLSGHGKQMAAEVVFHEEFNEDRFTAELTPAISKSALVSAPGLRLTVTWNDDSGNSRHRTFRQSGTGLDEMTLLRNIHPEAARRIELWRLSEFEVERLPSHEQLFIFRGQAKENPADERLFVFAEVRDIPKLAGKKRLGSDEHLLEFEQAYFEGIRVIQEEQAKRDKRKRYHWNRMAFYLRPTFDGNEADMVNIARRLEAPTRGLGLQKVVVRAMVPDKEDRNTLRETEIVISNPSRNRLEVKFRVPLQNPIRALKKYELSVIRARRMGLVYPYEIIRLLQGKAEITSAPHPDMIRGNWEEFDLDPTHPERLVSVQGRPDGENRSGVVVGIITNFTTKHPEGMSRVWIGSDSTKAMGALAEEECRRIIAALELAEKRELPVEWIPVSSGAKISMDSGTENLDWTARALRKIVSFTQDGGEINLIVSGVNVGAQSYWNAEATMLQHTRGILIMTPSGSMVLTGKKALEYSGSVAAEDERGIGGFDRIMGVNGQAQYFAKDLGDGYRVLMDHYRYTYRVPGEESVRKLETTDPKDRNVLLAPYSGEESDQFSTIGDIFDGVTNAERKKPFAIREVMKAVIDQDGNFLERWQTMKHAETAVIWDAHLGGHATTVIGFESRPQPRGGRIPMDGPDTWTGGTLFPQSSKKVARAINSASGNRPVVVLANLSGFDGSPESLRKLQLEHGAEIARAVVNFDGPIVFVVVGRYHGGAYVVFSKALNPKLTALALEGTFASVIGGAPAAAVVFPREVRARVQKDPRVLQALKELEKASPVERPHLRENLDTMMRDLHLEKQGEVATEFDGIHTVHRATKVGSLDAVIKARDLRPQIISVLDKALEEATNASSLRAAS